MTGGQAFAASVPQSAMPAISNELVLQGKNIYLESCASCHGLLGDGEGPAAPFMDPRPRDFTLGVYKFRTTASGALPTDKDIFRTISEGLAGTAMPGFDDESKANGLSEEQRWQVIAYLKSLAVEFEDEGLDPIKTGKLLALPANRAPVDAALIAQGAKIYESAKCWECHGRQGRGDGQKSSSLKDDWGFPTRIRNLTLPWKIKGGTKPEDLYMRFSAGMAGTPMPSYREALPAEDRWALAAYVSTLAKQPENRRVLTVGEVSSLPKTLDDSAWDTAPALPVRLTGQAIVAPRWQNPAVELVMVKALTDGKEIAFQMSWDDPFKDTTHDKASEFKANSGSSYMEMVGTIPRKTGVYRDAAALLFPAKGLDATPRPNFLRGDLRQPVALWKWSSDGAETGTFIARGWKQSPKPLEDDLNTQSAWKEGQWKIVIRRPLAESNLFAPGRFTPMAVNVWDGSNGEHGLIMNTSSWYFVTLPASTPMSAYIKGLLAFLAVAAIMWGLARKVTEQGRDE